MDAIQFTTLTDCLNSEDMEALSYYLAGIPRGEDLTEFVCCDGNAVIDIVENVVPSYATPLLADAIGTLFLDAHESVEQANGRTIKLVSILEDCDQSREIHFPDGECSYAFVRVPASTLCYHCKGVDELPGHLFVLGNVERVKIE